MNMDYIPFVKTLILMTTSEASAKKNFDTRKESDDDNSLTTPLMTNARMWSRQSKTMTPLTGIGATWKNMHRTTTRNDYPLDATRHSYKLRENIPLLTQ
jgi:hypothetical protein